MKQHYRITFSYKGEELCSYDFNRKIETREKKRLMEKLADSMGLDFNFIDFKMVNLGLIEETAKRKEGFDFAEWLEK